MPDKDKKPAVKGPKNDRAAGGEELVSLQEGRYGASWFVAIIGLILVAYFFVILVISNTVILKTVIDNQGGASAWASALALWLSANIPVIAYGATIFIIGYSLTLKKKGFFPRGRQLLRLFGVCTGFAAAFFLVLGLLYVFVLPGDELVGFSDNLEFYGLQLSHIIAWCSILGAITAYCWLPGKAGAKEDQGV